MTGVDLDVWILGAIALPLIAATLVLLTGRYPNLRETVSIGAGFLLAAITMLLWSNLSAARLVTVVVAEPLPGLSIAFRLDDLGMLFMLIAGFLWPVTTVYAMGYMRAHHEERQTAFYAWFAIAIASTMAIALSANLFTLFIFYEVLTLSTYPLVTHQRNAEARVGGRTYLIVLLGTSIAFFLLALIGTWTLAGTLEFTSGGVFAPGTDPVLLGILLCLFVFGIGKAAIMPFHRWLPAAMVAPTPVSALLHAVAVVKAGVFTLLKVIVLIFGIDLVSVLPSRDFLMYLAAASILIPSVIAMRQDNLKKRLAYSTVSQLNYIVLGALMASGSAVVGSAMHIAMHAFGKITLFFCAGALLVAAHKTNVSAMAGIGKQMPVTMTAFFIGSLAIIGVPPAGGTWSKWFLLVGTAETGHWVLTCVLLLSSLLAIYYLLSIPVRAFFVESNMETNDIKEAPLPMLIAMGTTALISIVLFFLPQPIHTLALGLLGQQP